MKSPLNVETEENYQKYYLEFILFYRMENVPKNLNYLAGSAFQN